MKILSNIVSIRFNDIEFNGLALMMDFSNMPFKNNKEATKWVDAKVEENTEEAKILVKEITKKMISKKIHINISWYLIYKYVGLFLALISLCFVMNYTAFATYLFLVGSILFVLKFGFITQARLGLLEMNFSMLMIDALFEVEKLSKEKETNKETNKI